MWHITLTKVCSVTTCTPMPLDDEEVPLVFVPVVSLDSWKVAPAELLSPGVLAQRSSAKGLENMALVMRDKSCDVLKLSARTGFRQLSSYHLDLLMSMLRPPFPNDRRLTRENDKLTFLLRHVLGDIPDDQVKAIIASRGKKTHEEPNNMLYDEEALEKLGHCMDDDDFQIVKDHSKAVRKQRQAKVVVEVAPKAPVERRPEAVGSRPWTVRPLPVQDDWDLQQARCYLPKAKGVSLSKDVRRFSRWTGVYPKGPTSHVSKSWGPRTGFSVHSALCFVLHQLWQWHAAETGERVKWDFAAELPEPAIQG